MQIIVVVRVDMEGVDGFGSGIFFWTLYGWREVPFARSISSSFRRVESEGETNCIWRDGEWNDYMGGVFLFGNYGSLNDYQVSTLSGGSCAGNPNRLS